MRYFSLAFSSARLNHLISIRNRSLEHLKKIFNLYILYSFSFTAIAGNIHINARTCYRHTIIHRSRSNSFLYSLVLLKPKCEMCVHCAFEKYLRWLISVCTQITYDAPNVRRFYHIDDGIGLSSLAVLFVPVRRDMNWTAKSSATDDENISHKKKRSSSFFSLYCSCGSYSCAICPFSTNPF